MILDGIWNGSSCQSRNRHGATMSGLSDVRVVPACCLCLGLCLLVFAMIAVPLPKRFCTIVQFDSPR